MAAESGVMMEPVTTVKGTATFMSMLAALTAGKFLGIPAGAFTAALLISLINEITNTGTSEKGIAKAAARVLLQTLLGGWISVFLMDHKYFSEYEIKAIGAPIVAGLVTFGLPKAERLLKNFAPELWTRIKEVLLNMAARWVAGRLPQPPPLPPDPKSGDQQ